MTTSHLKTRVEPTTRNFLCIKYASDIEQFAIYYSYSESSTAASFYCVIPTSLNIVCIGNFVTNTRHMSSTEDVSRV